MRTNVVANLMFHPYDTMFEQSRRVYGVNALAPAMHTVGGGNLEPKIIVVYETDNIRVVEG